MDFWEFMPIRWEKIPVTILKKIPRVRNTRIVASDPDFRCSAGEFGVCETVFSGQLTANAAICACRLQYEGDCPEDHAVGPRPETGSKRDAEGNPREPGGPGPPRTATTENQAPSYSIRLTVWCVQDTSVSRRMILLSLPT